MEVSSFYHSNNSRFWKKWQQRRPQILTSHQKSGSLAVVALSTCKKIQTSTSLNQMSSQTATVLFPNLPSFQQSTAQFSLVAPAMMLKTLMPCWGHSLMNLLWHLKESLPQTLPSVPLPKVSFSIEMSPEGPTLNAIQVTIWNWHRKEWTLFLL